MASTACRGCSAAARATPTAAPGGARRRKRRGERTMPADPALAAWVQSKLLLPGVSNTEEVWTSEHDVIAGDFFSPADASKAALQMHSSKRWLI